MTLIVAKIIDENLYIESDSKITGESMVRNNPLESQIKSLLLDSQLCLCYAGNINFAQDAYNYYTENQLERKDWNQFTDYLLKLNIKSNNNTDFILCGYDNNMPIILEIKDGNITNVKNSWIGNKIGFSKFQEFYQFELANKIKPENALSNAFKRVLEEGKIDSIGNLRFSITTNDKNYIDNVTGEKVKILQYQSYYEMVLGRNIELKLKGKGKAVPIPSGNETTGSYAISYFTPEKSLTSCVGVHFGYGKFGIFYPPKKLLNPIIYSSVNAKEFIDKILIDYNITLVGMDIIPGRIGAKYIKAEK